MADDAMPADSPEAAANGAVVEALADGSLSDADVAVAEALQLTPGETGCPPAEHGDE